MKQSKGANASPNHLQSRISYLFKAATYLTTVHLSTDCVPNQTPPCSLLGEVRTTVVPGKGDQAEKSMDPTFAQDVDISRSHHDEDTYRNLLSRSGMACQLLSHLRTISMKGQVHLSPNIKHSICKRCYNVLIPSMTMTSHTENKSKNGQKSWADVQVKRCVSCGTTKRFPTGMRRQPSKKERARKLSAVKPK